MKLPFSLLGIFAFSLSTGFSQDAAPSLTPDEMRASIANLEVHVGQREERMQETLDDIHNLDGRVEDGVDDLVHVLENAADSPESKTRVANVKEETIAGLKKMIDFYRQKRDLVREQLRTGNSQIPKETLENDLKVFDERIEKRVKQIVSLTASFTLNEDVEKYEVTGSYAGWWGETWYSEEISEEWKQNRRDVHKTNVNRKEVEEALAKRHKEFVERQKYLEEKLKGDSITDTERSFYEEDIARIVKTLRFIEEERDLLISDAQPDTRKVGRDEAYDLGKLLEDTRSDLRSDFFLIFQRYDELNKLRAQIATMKESLAARKAYLAEHGG